MCLSCGVHVVSSANSNQYKNTIPLEQVQNGTTLAELFYYRCLNREKLKQAFAQFGHPVETDDDIKAIAKIHDDGNDIKLFGKNFLEIARAINFTHEEMMNANCQIGLTR